VFDNLSKLSDRRDQSRVEIVSGGNVEFQGDSLTLATGGQIAVSATGRSFVANRAQLDVSGAVGVSLAMDTNNVKVNVQGNEQRDAPGNRDSGKLLNANVWIDRRRLIYVPAGVGGYANERWYTAGGLLEVGGYLANQGHRIGEWAAQGGTVTLGGNEVVTQAGSSINLSGGSLDVQTGYLRQTWFKGADGLLYNANNAPAGVQYTGVYSGFDDEHPRWGKNTTDSYASPLIAPQQVLQNGYTVGRDAGRLHISAPTAIIEGDVVAKVFNGAQQSQARAANLTDGYKQSQYAVAQAGSLALAAYKSATSVQDGATSTLVLDEPVTTRITVGNVVPGKLELETPIDPSLIGATIVDAARLSSFGLGGLILDAKGGVTIDAPLVLADGGMLRILAPDIKFNAGVTARSGSVTATNVGIDGVTTHRDKAGGASIVVAPGVHIDTRGLWTNAMLDPLADLSRRVYIDGGAVSLQSTGDVTLARGALIDASAGGVVLANGKFQGGKGGDIALVAGYNPASFGGGGSGGALTLEGELASYGFTRGGRLTLSHGGIVAINDAAFDLGTSMAAGQILPVDVMLTEGVVWPAGAPLPADAVVGVRKTVPEGVLASDVELKFSPGQSITLTADLVVEGNGLIGGVFGSYWYQTATGSWDRINTYGGGVIPKGSTLTETAIFKAGMTTVGNGTLDLGIVETTYLQGSRAPVPVSFSAGDRLAQNTLLAVPIKYKSFDTRHFSFEALNKGFSAYNIHGDAALFVGADAAVRPTMPVLRLTPGSYGVATGADPYGSLERYIAPVYQEDPTAAKLNQRPGVDLTLSSTSRVEVGRAASISVDPGHTVTLASGRQITVDGAITAPGGAVSLLDTYYFDPEKSPAVVRGNGPGATSMWIGEHAVLDVAARAYTALDAQGRRYGVVPDGGTISFGRVPGKEASIFLANAADAFIVIRPGARLDASGTSATLDLRTGELAATWKPATVASDGGTISLRSFDGIMAEGTLRAQAGGAGASGGRLEVVLESPYFADTPSNPAPRWLREGRVLRIGQDSVPGALPADIGTGLIDQAQALGQGAISAKQIEAGGFDTVSLWGRDAIAFVGDVSLTAGRSIVLSQGAIHNTVAGGKVRLDAPYVFLDGHTTVKTPNYQTVASLLPTSLTDITGGSFIASGGLVDVRNATALRYDDVRLASATDLRFLASTDLEKPITKLTAPGALTLAAAQVYPASNAVVDVSAGKTLSIERVGDTLPPLPYSAFGGITLAAPTVRQGGVLRAPFGSITLGQAGTSSLDTVTELLPGSVTSVSGAGLVMPYGGTADGTTYTVDGAAPITPSLLSGKQNETFYDAPVQGITLTGTQVIGAAGSHLDLSGGGTLLGAAFISGRGGSVDVLTTSLANANPANGFSAAGNKVYAIVPGATIAPPAGGYATQWKGAVPGIGQQVTIGAGVPGLPAGTYTLLPANYALVPGAWRVEVGATTANAAPDAMALSNGSWLLAGMQGIANTAIRDVLPTQLIVTPGAATRAHSQYNEQGYDAFQLAQAATFGRLPPLLSRDGKFLTINLSALSETSATKPPALRFQGTANMAPGQDGWGATLVLPNGPQLLSIGSPDSTTERSATVTPVSVADINAFGAPNLYIGGAPYLFNSTNLTFGIGNPNLNTGAITLEPGAILHGAQVTLGAPTITIASGAGIDTIGHGTGVLDFAATGYALGLADYEASKVSIVTASNGQVMLSAPAAVGTGKVSIGDGAVLRSEGSVGIWAANQLEFAGTPEIGTARLNLAVSSLNIGAQRTLADAARAGILPAGLGLDQNLLDRLLGGQPAAGVPAMRELVLSAANSVNFYGTTALDIGVGTLVLNSPAIYGYGTAGDTASLNVDRLVWNGTRNYVLQPNGTYAFVSATPGATIEGGPGSGQGRFTVNAREIVLGYPQDLHPLPDGMTRFDRLMLGFGGVNLNAGERILGNGLGSLSVFAQGPSPDASFKPDSYAGTGGALTLLTPLLTGAAGSSLDLRAGGTLAVAAPAGAAAPVADPAALGAQLRLAAGQDIVMDTALALPSGRLEMTAAGNITLGDHARLDLSGRTIPFFDVTRYTWGGDVVLESTHGNITQAAGAVIDLSAAGSDAGTLSLTATDAAAGVVRLAGTIHAQAAAGRRGGGFDIRAQRIGENAAALSTDFAALNTLLTTAGFSDSRAFALKQGDLVIGDELKAHRIAVSVDGGSLTINGKVDASGGGAGSIRLAARDALTVNGTLDAHGTVLRVDSDGVAIAAANTAEVELTTTNGRLTLAPGAVIDLRSADGTARGKLILNAPRLGSTTASATGAGAPANATGGDIAIDASGAIDIRGARSIALNGFASYANAPYQDGDATTRNQIITQAFLDLVDQDSQAFINGALANADLQGRLAGLTAHGNAFHLRPGVEIVSATPDGNLTVTGDLDLAGYRYGPQADRDPASSRYGAGEPLAFVLRAGGDLTVNGSISDGFGPGKPGVPNVYVGVSDVATSADFFLQQATGWGWPADYYQTYSNFYLVTDWTIPNNDFYAFSGGMYSADFSRYFMPGDTIPAGTQLDGFSTRLQAGIALPHIATDLLNIPPMPGGSAPAPSLEAGSLSASMRLAAGADLAAADTRALRARSALGGAGNILLSDYHTYDVKDWSGVKQVPIASSIRTGAGDLDLLAGGNLSQGSIYNISTHGGGDAAPADLFVHAQGTLGGWTYGQTSNSPDNWVNKGTLSYDDGFTGFGALNGGNVTVRAGGDAGVTKLTDVSTALVVGAAGGGDVTVNIGGRLNPNVVLDTNRLSDAENGVFTNLRGDLRIDAGAIGTVPLRYGWKERDDPRGAEPTHAAGFGGPGLPLGGVIVTPGDGDISLRTRSDLVLGGVARAQAGAWRPDTAIELFSAGGNLVPYNAGDNSVVKARPLNVSVAGGYALPAQFSATAAHGSIYYSGAQDYIAVLRLAPSPKGHLELLAQDSIYAASGNYFGSQPNMAARFTVSGADADPNLFTDPARLHEGDTNPIRIYAVNGDLVNVSLGEVYAYQPAYPGPFIDVYAGAKAASVRAGRDIVNFGQVKAYGTSPSLILNTNANDVSVIAAGRDMFYTNVQIAGPGTLEVTAGGNLYQGDKGSIVSLGPIADGDTRPGASIAVQAGAGPAGPDWSTLAAQYLNPANQADLTNGHPLADQPGKVAHTYDQELISWLKDRYGYVAANAADALAHFNALAPEQQRIFLRSVYFAELKAGGREYNDLGSPRYGSYLRGRDMIRTLFPGTGTDGNPVARNGDIVMFGGSGVRTLFGGDIQMLTPGGKQVIGVEGQVPPASSGLLTQGAGDIQLYSKGSILLGLSRIMTTFGGSIQGWSAEGDINAGRGAKTTVLYTPPKRVYDVMGNVTVSPNVPSSGAGIATLSPIPEVPGGDVDLVAPLGTIDAGEAGIRVSGNVNFAALQVVNAANVQVQGKSTGLPVVASVNVGALTNASAVASTAASAAQDAMSRERAAARQALPSVFSVRMLGTGNEAAPSPEGEGKKVPGAGLQSSATYDPTSPVQFVGLGGRFNPAQLERLTEEERRNLRQIR